MSAALSYHMVSELRLLISLNSRRSMEEFLEFQSEFFDPNLPPKFDIYPEDKDYSFHHVLPPSFDDYGDEDSLNAVACNATSPMSVHKLTFNEWEPYQSSFDKFVDEKLYSNVCLHNHFFVSIIVMNVREDEHETTEFKLRAATRSHSQVKIQFQSHEVDQCDKPNHITVMFSKPKALVFDPGGLERSKNRDDSF